MRQKNPIDAIIVGAYFSLCGVWGIINYFMDDPIAKMSKYAGKQLGFSLELVTVILIISGMVGAICSTVNIIGGVGILNLKSWARKLLNINFRVQVSFVNIDFFIVTFIVMRHFFSMNSFPMLITFVITLLILSVPIFYINTHRFKSLLK